MSTKLSFVIPCYKSQNTVEKVIEEIIQVVGQKEEYSYEIVAVNDCSPDNVFSVLERLCKKNKNIKAIDLAINGGKHAALMAGFSYASGDIVICVDDDGQCPVDHIWELIEPLDRGYDMSIAQYPRKKQSAFKNFGSKFNDLMVRTLIGKPKGLVFSNFIARKKFICEEIIKYKNPYPYLEGLTLRTTHNIALVPMEERARECGKSGYTLKKSMELWLNGCTAFSVKPLRIATVLGLLFSVVGFIMAFITIIYKLVNPYLQSGYASMVAIILFVGGVLMLLLGMIGEYVGRIYICLNNSPQYVIREKCNIENREDVSEGYNTTR